MFQLITRVKLPLGLDLSQGLQTAFVANGDELKYAKQRYQAVFGASIASQADFELKETESGRFEVWVTYKGEKRMFLSLKESLSIKKTSPFTSEVYKNNKWEYNLA